MNKMKKWGGCLAMVLALTMVLACSLVFTACSHTPGAGDTYVFEDYQISFSADVSEETKAMFNEENLASMKESMKSSSYVFVSSELVTYKSSADDIKGSSMFCKIEDGKVTVAPTKAGLSDSKQQFTIDGETLVAEQSQDGVTMKVIYKLSK